MWVELEVFICSVLSHLLSQFTIIKTTPRTNKRLNCFLINNGDSQHSQDPDTTTLSQHFFLSCHPSLAQSEDCRRLTKERHTGWVYRLEFSQVFLKMVLAQFCCLFQDLPFPLWYCLQRWGRRAQTAVWSPLQPYSVNASFKINAKHCM